MKILVTGATGILGRKLVDRLIKAGFPVVLLTRNGELKPAASSVTIAKGNLLEPESLEKAAVGMDIVIHLAAMTHTHQEPLYYEVNTKGTKNLIEACVKNKVKKIIYISTRAASLEGGAYAHSKLLAEEEIKKSSLEWIILRPAEVYGAGSKEAIAQLIELVSKSYFVPIIGKGRYTVSPVYVEDVLSAILSAINKSVSNQIYTLAGPREMTYNEMVDTVADFLRVKRVKIFIPVFMFTIAAVIFSRLGSLRFVPDQIPRLFVKKSSDIRNASGDLDFFPLEFCEGLKMMGRETRPGPSPVPPKDGSAEAEGTLPF